MVIGATADHRMLGMKPIVTDGPFKDVAVPFYVWASDDVKKAVDIHFDQKRVGSHKDIFPDALRLKSFRMPRTAPWVAETSWLLLTILKGHSATTSLCG